MSNNYLDIYYRVSTGRRRRERKSLEVQKDLGLRLQKNWLEPRFHNEGARSSTIQFPSFENLKYDIERLVKHLWVSDRSRLFRDRLTLHF